MNEELFESIKDDLKHNTLTGAQIKEILERKNPEIPIIKNKVSNKIFIKRK